MKQLKRQVVLTQHGQPCVKFHLESEWNDIVDMQAVACG